MFDGLIGDSHNHLYIGMKQQNVLTLPCLFLFNSLITALESVQSYQKGTQELPTDWQIYLKTFFLTFVFNEKQNCRQYALRPSSEAEQVRNDSGFQTK